MSIEEIYSGYFNSRFMKNEKRARIWRVLTKFLQKKFISKESVVLEIGTGYGYFINQLTAKEKHAADIQDVRRYLDKDVTFHKIDCTDLSKFQSDYFDIVFASNILEHFKLKEVIKAISQISRILKRGGLFIILQPNFRYCYKNYFDDYTHRTIFTHKSLSDLLVSEGFKLERVKPRFLPFSTYSRFPKFQFLIWPYLYFPFKPFAGQMLIVSKK